MKKYSRRSVIRSGNLTKAAAMQIIREVTGLADEEILETDHSSHERSYLI